MRLLLVEDHIELCQELREKLQQAGFAVDCATEGNEGRFMGESEPYDIIILDLGLPDISGLNILKAWRRRNIKTPVLILTARDAWHEKVDGFRAGADDYLSKPFHFEELLVRLHALLKRSAGMGGNDIAIGRLKLDEFSQSAQWSAADGVRNIILTGIEFRILRYMMLHPRHIVSASQLVEHVYDFNAEKESNVIEVYISRLRKKLGKNIICNRRGQGYYLNLDALHDTH